MYNIVADVSVWGPHRVHFIDLDYCYRCHTKRGPSVCLSVCCAHGWALQKQLNQSRCRLGDNSRRHKERCIRRGRVVILTGRDTFWMLSSPLTSMGSFCCGVRSNSDHSIINNRTKCDAAFRQNSLTTCYSEC